MRTPHLDDHAADGDPRADADGLHEGIPSLLGCFVSGHDGASGWRQTEWRSRSRQGRHTCSSHAQATHCHQQRPQ